MSSWLSTFSTIPHPGQISRHSKNHNARHTFQTKTDNTQSTSKTVVRAFLREKEKKVLLSSFVCFFLNCHLCKNIQGRVGIVYQKGGKKWALKSFPFFPFHLFLANWSSTQSKPAQPPFMGLLFPPSLCLSPPTYYPPQKRNVSNSSRLHIFLIPVGGKY